MPIDALQRYNEIQKALSSFRRESGISKFPASFQQTASQIYQSTKSHPLKQVINNIDENYRNVVPEIPEDILQFREFFNYKDTEAQLPPGVGIKSSQLHGDNWISGDPDYQIVFKDFAAYINANKDVFWTNSGDAPRFQFGQLDFNDLEGIYFVELTIDRDDAYGYQPGMGASPNIDVIPSEEKEKIEPLTDIKPPEELKPEKKAAKEIEIKKIKAETERLKASKEKLSELNKAVVSLDKKLEMGLITKTEYKKYLKKIYDI
jgi:hypothetical protein